MHIPRPRGYERQRLVDAFYSKQNARRKPSDPLTPENLYSCKGKIKNEQFNWLYLSVWFGLRPKEIDNLKHHKLWKVETRYNGKQILLVYQTKIIALPPEDRWKPIPIIFEE